VVVGECSAGSAVWAGRAVGRWRWLLPRAESACAPRPRGAQGAESKREETPSRDAETWSTSIGIEHRPAPSPIGAVPARAASSERQELGARVGARPVLHFAIDRLLGARGARPWWTQSSEAPRRQRRQLLQWLVCMSRVVWARGWLGLGLALANGRPPTRRTWTSTRTWASDQIRYLLGR
jgi:hypothetical protein